MGDTIKSEKQTTLVANNVDKSQNVEWERYKGKKRRLYIVQCLFLNPYGT